MTTNPVAKTILCFGDSNTWGQKPDKHGPYPVDVRWTGLLQRALGDEYDIVEEGLGGRTTDLDYVRKPGRNGRAYLGPCLESHLPISLVVLMLGTNDLKIEFDRSPTDIANAIEGLVNLIAEKTSGQAQILLVSPILIDDTASDFAKNYIPEYYDHESTVKSQHLSAAYEAVAQKLDCDFLDASIVAQAGEDGIHFSPEAHASLARVLTEKIQLMQLGHS